MATTPRNKTRVAKRFRRTMSEGEAMLWSQIKSNQIGFHVRRQVYVAPYYLDFYIEEAKLCIEVDGQIHNSLVERDEARDRFLALQGIETIRIPAHLLWEDLSTQVGWVHATACLRTGKDPLRD